MTPEISPNHRNSRWLLPLAVAGMGIYCATVTPLRGQSITLQASASQTVQSSAASTSTPGTVEGDIYLMMDNGDTKRGAGRTVYLLRNTDALRASLESACAAWQKVDHPLAMARAAAEDSFSKQATIHSTNDHWISNIMQRIDTLRHTQDALAAKMRHSINDITTPAIIDSANSGLKAHYKFPGIAPGSYFLMSTWTIDGKRYLWWRPIDIQSLQSQTIDLDNQALTPKPYCSEG